MRKIVRIEVVVGLAVLLASGCLDFSLRMNPTPTTEHFDTRETREDPGPTLVSGARGMFAYTPDGGALLYVVDLGTPMNSLAIHATTLADGSQHGASDWPLMWDRFVLTPDGEALYYLAYDPDAYDGVVLREAYSHANVDLGAREPYAVAASPDSAWLLVSATEGSNGGASTTVALERATGALVSTPCAGADAAVFSPAGDELLCYRWNADGTATVVRFRLEDQVSQELPGVAACSGSFRSAWWGPGGIRIACWPGGVDVVVGDPETGSVIASTNVGGWYREDIGPFSPDGGALALTSGECLEGERFKGYYRYIASCSRIEWQVKVLDLASSEVSLIASSGAGTGPMAFSADGKTLTYLLGSDIHVRPSGR